MLTTNLDTDVGITFSLAILPGHNPGCRLSSTNPAVGTTLADFSFPLHKTMATDLHTLDYSSNFQRQTVSSLLRGSYGVTVCRWR